MLGLIHQIGRCRALSLVFVGVLALVMTGCGSGTPVSDTDGLTGSFSIIGSNTVTPLSAVWAEEFMQANPKVNIAVSGPGTGAGIAALINGTTDICQASRKIKDKEIDQSKASGVNPVEFTIATDALSVVVHPSNPIDELTITQISAIYNGKITNWNELGGDDRPVVALARDTNSGTHVYFKEVVVQMAGLAGEDKSLEYGAKVLLLPSTEEGVSEVAKNPNAIFYPGLGYLTDRVKALGIQRTASDAGVKPSLTTALDGTYPISRPLLFYTDGEPAGPVKAFIDYCLSADGQAMVNEVGYVPLQ